jgi:hypothetical protein
LLQTGWSRQIATETDAMSNMFEDETTDPFDARSKTIVGRSEPDRRRSSPTSCADNTTA